MPHVAAKTSGNPATLEGLKLGVIVRSTASFPMEIRIDELETQIADRVPTEAFYARSVKTSQGLAAHFTTPLSH